MMNQLLEDEELTPAVFNKNADRVPFLSLVPVALPEPPILVFEWQTDDNDDDVLRWTGDIDTLLGFPEGEFPRMFSAWVETLHPDDRDAVLDAIQTHLVSGEPYSVPCRMLRHDGKVLYYVHSGESIRDQNGNPIKLTGTLQNIAIETDDNNRPHLNGHAKADQDPQADQASGEIQSAHREDAGPSAKQRAHDEQGRAQALLRAAANLNAQLDLHDVCEAICAEAARMLNAPSAVMLFNKSRDAFVPTAVRDMPVDYEKRYIPTMRSIYNRHVSEMGTLFLFTDAQATPDLPNFKLYEEVDMRTIGIASLIREGEVLGLLKVYSFVESRTFDANELAFLQGLADLAAQAIANARLLAESERRLANLNALRQIDKAILGSSDVNLALGVVLDQVLSRLDADASCALLLDPHTRTLRYAAGRGFRTNTPRRTDWQLGEGLAGRAALERRVIYVPDLSQPDLIAADFTDPELKLPGVHPAPHTKHTSRMKEDETDEEMGARSKLRRTGIPPNEGFVSYHGVPLVANGQVKGVLEVWQRAPFLLEEEELEFLETLAGQAAIAVDNATLFRDLQRSNDELVLAYDSTLAGWSGALDLRDKETEGHSERVTRETLRLAQEMGLSAAELVNIRRGALLHDIGKMGIPDAILLKPGPLTDEEWLVMKKHPTYALELLAPIDYLRPALDIPYAHHERWDGSGYPRGLKGDQIPLTARMFAVVDVWDALCSDRPYREGWPIEYVMNHIRQGAGSHFDPAVVKAFLRLHEHEISPQTSEQYHNCAPEATQETALVPLPVAQATSEPMRHPSWAARVFKAIMGAD